MGLSTEAKRKLVHLSSGIFPLAYLLGISRPTILWIAGEVLALVLFLEITRLKIPWLNQKLLAIFGQSHRPEELTKPSGALWTLAGVFLGLLLFEKQIAVFSLFVLSISDGAAAMVGQRWGKHKIGKKSLEGSAAFFVSAVLIGLLLLPPLAALGGALAATLAEAVPFRIIDDNIRIPIVGGLAATLLI